MRALFFLAPFVIALGCAEERYGAVATTWDQASSSSPSSPAPPPIEHAKVTAKEAAAEIHGAGECMARAKDYYGKDHRAGQTLLAECVHKSDFIDLDGFLRGPWTKDLATSEPFQVLAAEVIAHRGGFVEQDAKTCRAAGVSIYDVTTAMVQGKRAAGHLVLVRGAVVDLTSEKWGTGKSTVATVAESTWAEDGNEDGATIPVRDAVEDSGRLVYARVEKREARFSRGHALVIAMRLEGPRVRKISGGDNDGDEEKSIIGVAVALFDCGGKLRQ